MKACTCAETPVLHAQAGRVALTSCACVSPRHVLRHGFDGGSHVLVTSVWAVLGWAGWSLALCRASLGSQLPHVLRWWCPAAPRPQSPGRGAACPQPGLLCVACVLFWGPGFHLPLSSARPRLTSCSRHTVRSEAGGAPGLCDPVLLLAGEGPLAEPPRLGHQDPPAHCQPAQLHPLHD